MQQRSWTHFRDAVNLIQAGSLGRIVQVRTYWWQNYQQQLGAEADRPAGARLEEVAGRTLQISLLADEKFDHWRWFWNFGGGAMTDLFTHWIDVVHWAMKADQPKPGVHARRQICFRCNGIAPIPFRPHSAIPDSTSFTKA